MMRSNPGYLLKSFLLYHIQACLFHNRLCLVSTIYLFYLFCYSENAFRKARNKNQCIMFFEKWRQKCENILVMSFCQLCQISKLHLSFCCSCSQFSSNQFFILKILFVYFNQLNLILHFHFISSHIYILVFIKVFSDYRISSYSFRS